MTIKNNKTGGDQLPLSLFSESEYLSPIIPTLLSHRKQKADSIRVVLMGKQARGGFLKRPLTLELEHKQLCKDIEFLKQILGYKYARYISE